MRKGNISFYFAVNNQQKKTSRGATAMCCLLMFNSNLKARSKKSMDKPLRNKMQHLLNLMIIYKILKRRYRLSSMRILDCSMKFMQRISRLENARMSPPIFENVM